MRGIFAAVTIIIILIAANVVLAATTNILRPTSDGTDDSALWSTKGGLLCTLANCATEVNESSGGSCTNSDGDATYITSSTNGAVQTFGIDLSSVPDGSTITQIDISLCAKRAQGGAMIQTRRCIAGSCANSGTNIVLSNSYAESNQSYGGLSILKSNSTSLEIGVANTASKGSIVSQISGIVTYTPPAASDTTAPGAVSDLAAGSPGQTSVPLTWTAPGDDGSTGTATSYDVRYSTSLITSANFASATQASGEPSPSIAGTAESFTVSSLSANTTYYFAMKTSDEVPNTSSISNVISVTTAAVPDTTAPSAVADLSGTATSDTAIALSWTAPGDDGSTGTASSYDVRYAAAAIDESTWASATQVTGEPTPSLAGTSESFSVTGLTASTTYYFAMKTTDESNNTSSISNSPSVATNALEPVSNVSIPVSGGGVPRSITISGYAYPGATLTLLQHNENEIGFKNIPIKNIEIQPDGQFSAGFIGLTAGNYLVALRIKDKFGYETGLISLSVNFEYSGDRFVLDNFIAPPTIGFKKRTLFTQDALEVEGYSSPGATVTLSLDDKKAYDVVSNKDGYWRLIEKTGLPIGSYNMRAFQTLADGSASSSPSIAKTFRVSDLAYPEADFNNDGVINITDWSLFLFRWSSKESSTHALIDLDGNGNVDIGDFSIFLRAMKL